MGGWIQKVAVSLKDGVLLEVLGFVRTCACEPNENAKTGNFGKALGNEGPTDGRRAGIDGLIDQCRCPPEIGQVT